MSVSVQSLLWKLRLPATEKLVAIRLGDFARDDGTSVFPAVQTVADECGITDRAVQITIKKLLNSGVLVQLSDGRGGRGRTTEYAFDLERIRFLIENPELASPIRNPEKGENGESGSGNKAETPNVVRKTPNDVHPIHYEPLEEEEGCASAQSQIVIPASSAVEIIRAFDAERVSAFGPEQARGWLCQTDRIDADRWIAAGADLQLCQDVFRDVCQRRAKAGRDPPGALSFFEQRIANAIAERNRPLPEASHVEQRRPAQSARRGGWAAEYLERTQSGS